MNAKPTVYIETSVVSYLSAWPSKDPIISGHQLETKKWWKSIKPKVSCYVSQMVIDEASQGDARASKLRLESISKINFLEFNLEVISLAEQYKKILQIPERAAADASHLAISCFHRIDYLLSWNCVHIASARVNHILRKFNEKKGLHTPELCTPSMLMEV